MQNNAFIAVFNGRLKAECLDASRFLSMGDAHTLISDWKTEYNETRRHSLLKHLTPSEFAAQLNETRKVA